MINGPLAIYHGEPAFRGTHIVVKGVLERVKSRHGAPS